MKILVSWLLDYIEIEQNSPQRLEAKMIQIGIEVEKFTTGLDEDNFMLARIDNINKHPNADRLSICKLVEYDNEVVCGATNLSRGMTTILAKIGAVLPNGMEIKKSSIRGVESHGMLCSSAELNLEELDPKNREIMSIQESDIDTVYEFLGESGSVYDVSITTNRQDLMSLYGIARELSCFGLGTLKTKEINLDIIYSKKISSLAKFNISILNIKLSLRIKSRLHLSCILYNDPLDGLLKYISHIFGYKLSIDHMSSKYNPGEYIILITRDDNRVMMRSACDIKLAISEFIKLAETVSENVTVSDIKIKDLPEYYEDKKFCIPYEDCLLANISDSTINKAMYELGFTKDGREYIVPKWRTDIIDVADILNDIVRYVGIDNIPEHALHVDQYIVYEDITIDKLRDFLRYTGGLEIVNRDFISKEIYELFQCSVKIHNPMNIGQYGMRSTLLATLLETYARYKRYNWPAKMLFEGGDIFNRNDSTSGVDQCQSIAAVFDPYLFHWLDKKNTCGLYMQAKNIFEQSVKIIYGNFSIESSTNHLFKEGCEYIVGGNTVARFGVISDEFFKSRTLKCNSKCYAGEIFINDINATNVHKYHTSNQQVLSKDISFEIPEYHQVGTAISNFKKLIPYDTEAVLHDIYPNCNSDNQKTITMRIYWHKLERAMHNDDINTILEGIYNKLSDIGYKTS